MRLRTLSAVTACLVTGAVAPAVAQGRDLLPRPWLSISDGGSTAAAQLTGHRSSFSGRAAEEPSEASGLPAAAENIELVSELNPQRFGGVRIGEIADLTVHKGFAYLNSWDNTECDRGGTYVVDIRDVTAPREVGYIPPIQPFYHGEGAHAISVDTPAFKGDILAVNDETYGSNVLNDCGPADVSRGGFDLYDVSDPTAPKVLVQGAGDRDNGTPAPGDDLPAGNSYHSVFVWQAGPRAYLVASDNIEFQDVDIFDITDPKSPVQVADIELAAMFPQILDNEKANAGNVFNHDMIVKRIGDRFIMSVSNWDAGYVQIDVTDPANPTYVTDTTFGLDPLRPSLTAEGNAHQSEFSADNQFLLAADEDFATVRTTAVRVTSGPGAGDVVGVAGSDSIPVYRATPDRQVDGPTRFIGTACDGSAIPAPPAVTGAQDAIAVIERGVCARGFAEKLENAAAAGYDAGVVFNQRNRPDGDPLVSMATGNARIPSVFVTRATAVGTPTVNGRLFPGLAGATPAVGAAGASFLFSDAFDGWGYAHLYDAKTSVPIDSYAVPEAQDARYAEGFGDLSVHEFATDPTEPIAYSAYYGAGMRTFRFSRAEGLVPTGKWIDDDGNGSNFWGVEAFTGSDGERYLAGSDRDFGLQIFRYTGPGAARKPSCSDTSASTAPGTPVEVVLTCTDPNAGNTLTRSIATPPANGTLSNITGDKVTYTPNADFRGQDTFAFKATDGAAESNVATARVTVAGPAPTPTATPSPYVIRVRAGLSAKVRPKHDRRRPFRFTTRGRLKPPSGMSREDACQGRVRITVKRASGKKTLSSRAVRVRRSCAFVSRVRFRTAKRLGDPRGTLRFKIRFEGNELLLPRTIRRTARYGR